MSSGSSKRLALLAVYGTLKRNCANHDRLLECGCQYQRDCLIPGRLYDVGAYPGLKLPESSDKEGNGVHGELYQCPVDAFPALDTFEGAIGDQPLFERTQITLIEPKQEAWVYEYAREVSDSAQIEQW